MEDDAIKKVQERLEALPKDVREAIESSEFEARIAKIGQENRLHIDQIGELGDETMLVMLGFTSLEGFAERIQKNLHIYAEQASAIATAINNDVFLPIRESIKKFQTGGTPKPASPAPIAPAPSSATPTSPAPIPPQSPQKPPLSNADMMLSQKTMSMPAQKPPQPVTPPPPAPGNSYKVDPYREPAD